MHLAFGSRLKAQGPAISRHKSQRLEVGVATGSTASVSGESITRPATSLSIKRDFIRASPIGPIWPGNEGTQVRRQHS